MGMKTNELLHMDHYSNYKPENYTTEKIKIPV